VSEEVVGDDGCPNPNEVQGTRNSTVEESEGKQLNCVQKAALLLTLVTSDGTPNVIPLQVSGSIDCDLSKITANELMAWGLMNMWARGC